MIVKIFTIEFSKYLYYHCFYSYVIQKQGSEQAMLEKEAEQEEKRKKDEAEFWNQFPEERMDFA